MAQRLPGVTPTAIVYIDGLNLYKRSVENAPNTKWLNPLDWAQRILPGYEITLVRYFTTEVKAIVTDSEAPARQRNYLRALKTLAPKLSIHEGKMLASPRNYPIHPREIDEVTGKSKRVKVRKTEEKGSDVALASHMVLDASRGLADLYVLVSSDSDFAPALQILKSDLKVTIGYVSTNKNFTLQPLNVQPEVVRIARLGALQDSQFASPLFDEEGPIHRPETW